MMLLSAFFLIAGAAICLVAAVGVLRLPDFFLRAHAATEAGVAGCGLVLIGVGFAYPSLEMWIKIGIAIAFLLMTTPIAGHLLSRAGYVAGVPLWGGTTHDELEGELGRGAFERPAGRSKAAGAKAGEGADPARIVVALSADPSARAAMELAVRMARDTAMPLQGLAIVDTKMLSNVGPVPIGGNYYASQLRQMQIEKARQALADAVEHFEAAASAAGVACSVVLEEGDPLAILPARRQAGDLLVMGREAWFDHGVAGGRKDPAGRLLREGIRPLVGVANLPAAIREIRFVHDGSRHSDATLRWFLKSNLWHSAGVAVVPGKDVGADRLAEARRLAARRRHGAASADPSHADVLVLGNESRGGWFHHSHGAHEKAAIVVFG